MPEPERIDLTTATPNELLDLIERAQEAYAKALEREDEQRERGRDTLLGLAEQLSRRLGPSDPKIGDLTSLNAACAMSPSELAKKSEEVLHMLLVSLRDVTVLAHQSILAGAAQTAMLPGTRGTLDRLGLKAHGADPALPANVAQQDPKAHQASPAPPANVAQQDRKAHVAQQDPKARPANPAPPANVAPVGESSLPRSRSKPIKRLNLGRPSGRSGQPTPLMGPA